MNRLLENRTLSPEEMVHMIKDTTNIKDVMNQMATVGNAKLLFQHMKAQNDPLIAGQALRVLTFNKITH